VGSRSRARARAQASEARAAAATVAASRPAAAGAGAARPVTVRLAAVVQAVEVAGMLIATVLAGLDTASGKSYQTASGVALTIIGICAVIALGYVALGLARGRRWSRTPALLTQLFTGIVGIYLLQGLRYQWGVPAIVLALAGFALLLAPPSIRALAAGQRSWEDQGGSRQDRAD
jgi:hypothetical protein